MATPITSSNVSRCERHRNVFRVRDKAIRTVLRWQLLATTALAGLSAYWAGVHGALSAALGGAVSIASALVFAFVTSRSKNKTVEGTLVTALKAEGVKVGIVVVLLWVVFATYKDVVALAFIGAFIATVLISSMAFFVRD